MSDLAPASGLGLFVPIPIEGDLEDVPHIVWTGTWWPDEEPNDV